LSRSIISIESVLSTDDPHSSSVFGGSKELIDESKELIGESTELIGESKELIGESKELISESKELISESKESVEGSKENTKADQNIIRRPLVDLYTREDKTEDDISETSSQVEEDDEEDDSKSDIDGYSSVPHDLDLENEKEEEDESDEDDIEDAIFEKELRDFSKEMKLNITKDSKREELDFLTTYYATVRLIALLGAEEGDTSSQRVSKVMKKLKDWSRDRKDGTWTLSIKEKKCAAELLTDTLNFLVGGSVREGIASAVEAKKRAEKEFQSSGETMKDRILSMRYMLFADAIIVSYVQDREVVLPPYLLSELQQRTLFSELHRQLLRLHTSVSRKKSESAQKQKRSKTREVFPFILFDNLMRSVYPLLSECSIFHSPYSFLQRYSRLEMKLDVGHLPEREETSVPIQLGKYFVRNTWTQDPEEEKIVEFQAVFAFIWKQKNSIFIRTKQTVYEIPNTKSSPVGLWLSFDDEYDIFNLSLADSDQSLVGTEKTPGFVKRDLMEEAQGGRMDTEPFAEITKFGLFYLDSVFGFRIDSTDGEHRTLLHYAAWIGKPEVCQLLLNILPSLAFSQDEYGDTPVNLAVKGGKNCLPTLRLLLQSIPPYFLNIRNGYGQTALHISTVGTELNVTEALIKAGASTIIKDMNGLMAVDLVDANSNINKKLMLQLFRKFSR